MFAPFFFNHAVHKLKILNAHAPVKYIGVGFFAGPVAFFRERQPRSVGGGSCFLDNLRGKPVVMRPDKTVNVVHAVFVVVAHSGGQLVKAHVLA